MRSTSRSQSGVALIAEFASPPTAAAAALTGVIHRCEDALTKFETRTVVLPIGNIDTDQIIPTRFLKTISKGALGDQFFYDWRYDTLGRPRADFVL